MERTTRRRHTFPKSENRRVRRVTGHDSFSAAVVCLVKLIAGKEIVSRFGRSVWFFIYPAREIAGRIRQGKRALVRIRVRAADTEPAGSRLGEIHRPDDF